MSSYKHRRTTNPATAFPSSLADGEIAVNTANRQLAVGDPLASGAPLPLIAVRVFSTAGQYAIGDYVVQAGQLYRAKAAVSPGAFNAANWDAVTAPDVTKAYVDAGDAAVTTAFQNADALKAPLASPAFSGTPTAPTPPLADLTTKLATAAYVNYNNIIANNVDLNTIVTPGLYACSGTGNNPNEPTGAGQWYLIVWGYGTDPNHLVQLAISLLPDASVYTRTKVAGTWRPWVAIGVGAATVAEYLANSAPTKTVTPGAAWGAAALVMLADAATVTPDLSLGINFQWTIAAAGRTIANPINGKPGQTGIIYLIFGAGTSITTWGSNFKFPGGVKPTSTSNGIDMLSYAVGGSGTTVWCSYQSDLK